MDTSKEIPAAPRKQTFKTLLMAALLAAPLIVFYDTIFWMYKCTSDVLLNAKDICSLPEDSSFYYIVALISCAIIAAAGVYFAAVRLLAGIDTNLKKFMFAAAKIFYLLPLQFALLVLFVAILQTEVPDWHPPRALSATFFFASLAMSLWTYRILVSRKNPALKVVLAPLSNFILFAGGFAVMFQNHSAHVYISFALQAAWLAASADITFEGFGYRLIQKAIDKTTSKIFRRQSA